MSLEALVAGAGDRAALEAEAERAATAVVSIGGMVGAKEGASTAPHGARRRRI